MVTNRSAPPGALAPVLVYPDVREAVAWLSAAFGFVETVRIGEGHRAQMSVAPGVGMVVAEAHGEQQQPTPGAVTHVIKIRVDDAAAGLERALAQGATLLEELTERNYGELECLVADPAGHRWQLTQSVRDVAPEEWGGVSVGQP